ncbi:hypothetical protein HRbin30_01843 [bacterium HR30]|nr:hypothetical protein HRbin30_01843 [bacterium HR30]
MAWADEGGRGLPGGSNEVFLEGDALVPREDGLAGADEPVAVADRRRHVGYLVPSRLPLAHATAKPLERLEEERLDVVRLKPPCLSALHILPDAAEPLRIDDLVHKGALLHETLDPGHVHCFVDDAAQPRSNLGLLPVPDSLNQQVAERPPLELELPQNIEHLATQSPTSLFKFPQQRVVDVTFAGLDGHQVPEVTGFGLPDAVDAAEALLDAVRVPRKIVIDHEVRPLEVDALAGGVGGYQDLDFGVVEKSFLGLLALFPAHAPVDRDHRPGPAEQGGDALHDVVQRVPVLGKNHEFLSGRCHRSRQIRPVSGGRFRNATGDGRRSEEFGEEVSELRPFPVLPALPHTLRQRL